MTYSFAQAMDMFPEAAPAARRASKAKIKELNSAISGLSDFRDIWTRDIQKMHFKMQPAYIEYLDDLVERLREGYEKEIKKYQWQLSYLDNLGKPQKTNAVTELQVERAKRFPIRELLEVRRGVTLCLWHDDHRPSMKVYDKQNRVYCFACGRGGDSIDVYMSLNGCDFRTAVKSMAP